MARRTPEQMIADLQTKIETLKARREGSLLRQYLPVKKTRAGLTMLRGALYLQDEEPKPEFGGIYKAVDKAVDSIEKAMIKAGLTVIRSTEDAD